MGPVVQDVGDTCRRYVGDDPQVGLASAFDASAVNRSAPSERHTVTARSAQPNEGSGDDAPVERMSPSRPA